MEKQELLNLLYSERQRLSERYSKPGWNNWVILGAILYCILFFIDILRKDSFVLSNVSALVGFLFFLIVSCMLFNNAILEVLRGFIEERFKYTTIKHTLKIVKISLIITIVIYWINIIFELINAFKKFQTIDFYSITLITSCLVLVFIFIGISQTSMIDKNLIRILRSHLFGILLMFSSFMIANYFKIWTSADYQFSIIIVVFVITIVILWYSNIDKDISSIDSLIDDVIFFDIIDSNVVLEHLKTITINASIDVLFTHKISRISDLKLQIHSSLNILTKTVNQMNTNYFRKTDAKEIRENFFAKSNEITKCIEDYLSLLRQMSNELDRAVENIQNIRKKNRIHTTTIIISELVSDADDICKYLKKLIDKGKEKLPQCVSCENCSINCDNEVEKS